MKYLSSETSACLAREEVPSHPRHLFTFLHFPPCLYSKNSIQTSDLSLRYFLIEVGGRISITTLHQSSAVFLSVLAFLMNWF